MSYTGYMRQRLKVPGVMCVACATVPWDSPSSCPTARFMESEHLHASDVIWAINRRYSVGARDVLGAQRSEGGLGFAQSESSDAGQAAATEGSVALRFFAGPRDVLGAQRVGRRAGVRAIRKFRRWPGCCDRGTGRAPVH